MTIAIGILTTDGIVVAADTEESIPGYMKRSQSKIVGANVTDSARSKRRVCAIAGAGTAGYIDALSQELVETFYSHEPVDYQSSTKAFRKGLRLFYREHVIPFAAFPEQERGDAELLIAFEDAHTRGLLQTHKTTLTKCHSHAAVGTGAMFARILLDRLNCFTLDMAGARLLAVYVIHRVKAYIDGCGKFTDVMCLRNRRMMSADGTCAIPLERLFDRFEFQETKALHYVIGNDYYPPDPSALASQLEACRQDVLKFAASLNEDIKAVDAMQSEPDPGPSEARRVRQVPKHGRKRPPPSRE